MNYLENGRRLLCRALLSPEQYHGLTNQGATCYLNSVLQVLFMTKDFREAVKRHTCDNPDTECIDRHLASLFEELKRHTAHTNNITTKLGIDRVYEQRDAAEYFEKILSLTSPEASQTFHGLLTQKTVCSTCCTETGADGPFWHLPLALVDSMNGEDYSVVNGIKEYFRTSDFSGDNQMYCDQCDAKSDATIKCVIKHHPEVLMLLLKRFEFDYHYMTYVKINCAVDVPYTLQIPENQTYELYAFVEHFGDHRSGHYTATINDDEKWYDFNDDRVTLRDYQPFQVDKKSKSAYLLFYRKTTVHAADTCTQDAREAFTPGGFPPATGDVYDQRQEAGKTREREEVEVAVEAGNDTVVAVSVYGHEETGIKDRASVGLSPDLYNVEDQDNGVYTRESIPPDHQECNEESAYIETQRDKGKAMMKDEEDMGADDQAEKTETLSGETQLEESVDDQDNDSGGLVDVRQRRPQEGLEGDDMHNTLFNDQKYKQEVDNMHARQDRPLHVHVDVHRDEERMIMGVNMAGDEGSERRREAPTKYLNRDEGHRDDEGFDDVRQIIDEDKEGKQKIRHDYDLTPASVDKQGDKVRMETDVKVDTEGKTRADELASGGGKLLTIYDLYSQESGRVGDSKLNTPRDDQQGSSGRYERRKQKREEKRDVEGFEEQKRGDDKRARRRETSVRKPHLSEGVEDQDKRRLGDVRQRRPQEDPEQEMHATCTTHEDVGVDERGDEERMETDVKVDTEGKIRADELASGGGKLLTKYDLFRQESGRAGDSKHDTPRDDQRCKQGSSGRCKRCEQPRKERDASSERQHFGQGIEDQNNGRFDGFRQNRSEQTISVARTTHRDVGAAKQAKERERTGYNEREVRADSSLRQAGSRGPTESPGARTWFNEDTGEGRRGSKKSRIIHGMIIEEEFKQTPSGTRRSSETSHITIETVEGTSQDGMKSWVEYSDGKGPKRDSKIKVLPKLLRRLKLGRSPSQEPQILGTKGVTGNEAINSTIHQDARKRKEVSDAQEEAAGMIHATAERRGKKRKLCSHSSPLEQPKKKKPKKKKTIGCLPFCRKDAERTSESD